MKKFKIISLSLFVFLNLNILAFSMEKNPQKNISKTENTENLSSKTTKSSLEQAIKTLKEKWFDEEEKNKRQFLLQSQENFKKYTENFDSENKTKILCMNGIISKIQSLLLKIFDSLNNRQVYYCETFNSLKNLSIEPDINESDSELIKNFMQEYKDFYTKMLVFKRQLFDFYDKKFSYVIPQTKEQKSDFTDLIEKSLETKETEDIRKEIIISIIELYKEYQSFEQNNFNKSSTKHSFKNLDSLQKNILQKVTEIEMNKYLVFLNCYFGSDIQKKLFPQAIFDDNKKILIGNMVSLASLFAPIDNPTNIVKALKKRVQQNSFFYLYMKLIKEFNLKLS